MFFSYFFEFFFYYCIEQGRIRFPTHCLHCLSYEKAEKSHFSCFILFKIIGVCTEYIFYRFPKRSFIGDLGDSALSNDLIRKLFVPGFGTEVLSRLEDQATLDFPIANCKSQIQLSSAFRRASHRPTDYIRPLTTSLRPEKSTPWRRGRSS